MISNLFVCLLYIRLCVPQKHERKSCELKPLGSPILQSPVISRSASPSSHSGMLIEREGGEGIDREG